MRFKSEEYRPGEEPAPRARKRYTRIDRESSAQVRRGDVSIGKMLVAFLVVVVLAVAPVIAQAGNDNANPCGNNGNNCNTGGAATANATAVGVGIGVGIGTGGDASAKAYGGSATANSVNILSNKQDQSQGQHQGQVQGQHQGQGQSQSANNEGVKQKTDVTVEGDHYSVPRQAVPASAPATATTAVCMIGYSGGVGTVVGGISLGGAVRDHICSLLEIGTKMVATGLQTGNGTLVERGEALLFRAERELIKEIGEEKVAQIAAKSAIPEQKGND